MKPLAPGMGSTPILSITHFKMTTQLAIMKTLDDQFGREVFESVTSQILGMKAGKAEKASKTGKGAKKESGPYPKGEVPEHLKEWHSLVATVREEMTEAGWTHPDTGKPPSHRDAMAEASKRKDADATPEELAKKQAAAARKAAKKAESEGSDTGSSEKKRGRPKMTDEQKAAAKAAREAKKEAEGEDTPKKEPKKEPKKAGKKEAKKVAEPEPEAVEAEPCEIDGKSCIKIVGDYIYEYDDGEVGTYLGQMKDGELDTTVPEP